MNSLPRQRSTATPLDRLVWGSLATGLLSFLLISLVMIVEHLDPSAQAAMTAQTRAEVDGCVPDVVPDRMVAYAFGVPSGVHTGVSSSVCLPTALARRKNAIGLR
jgi:hypothetical protein